MGERLKEGTQETIALILSRGSEGKGREKRRADDSGGRDGGRLRRRSVSTFKFVPRGEKVGLRAYLNLCSAYRPGRPFTWWRKRVTERRLEEVWRNQFLRHRLGREAWRRSAPRFCESVSLHLPISRNVGMNLLGYEKSPDECARTYRARVIFTILAISRRTPAAPRNFLDDVRET